MFNGPLGAVMKAFLAPAKDNTSYRLHQNNHGKIKQYSSEDVV